MGLIEMLKTLMNSNELIQAGGLAVILLIVYAENGLFFGFFLPGDYLLFSTGLFCSSGVISTPVFITAFAVALAALLGTLTGYYFGKVVGKKLLYKKDNMFFKYKHVVRTRLYYMKYGGNTLLISKFLPIVRTFAPILAGVVEMDFKKFFYFSIIGCLVWGAGLVLLGYYLGSLFPNIVNYLEYIIIAFLVVTTAIVVKGFLSVKKTATS